jgi:DNA-binding MarR family transcriptional regulator
MNEDLDAMEVAAALQLSIGGFLRRLRQQPLAGDLRAPERSALRQLEASGPATSAALARLEQISPQSMGATVSALEGRGLIERRPDPTDGRRVVLSVTDSGRQALQHKRDARVEQLAGVLSTEFTRAELEQLRAVTPLIERLTQHL